MVCALVVQLVIPQPANGYALSGWWWWGNPPPQTCCAVFGVQQASSWLNAKDAEFWGHAIGRYNASYAAGQHPAYMAVTSASPLYVGDYGTSGNQAGITYIVLNYGTTNQLYMATSLINFYRIGGWTIDQGAAVAEHELGHAIGLDHTYGGCNIMLYDASLVQACGTYWLQVDDFAGIWALY